MYKKMNIYSKLLSIASLLICFFVYGADQPHGEDTDTIILQFMHEEEPPKLRINRKILLKAAFLKHLAITHGEEQLELRIKRSVLLTFPYFQTRLKTQLGVKPTNILEIKDDNLSSTAIQFFADIIQELLKSYADLNIFFQQLEKQWHSISPKVIKALSNIFSRYKISPTSYDTLYNLAEYLYFGEPKLARIIALVCCSNLIYESPKESINFEPEFDSMVSKMLMDDTLAETVPSYDQMELSAISVDIAPTLGKEVEFRGLQTDYIIYFAPTTIGDTYCLIYSKPLSANTPSLIRIPDNNHTVDYPIIAADYKSNALVYIINKNGKFVLCITQYLSDRSNQLNPMEYIIPIAIDEFKKTKIIFKYDSNYEFYVKIDNNLYLFDLAEEINFNNTIGINQIENQWTKTYFTQENPMIHTCTAIEDTSSFFNTNILHALDFPYGTEPYTLNKIYRKNIGSDANIIQCICDKQNNIHYILFKKEPNIYYAIRRKFNPDPKVHALLNFMNKQYNEKLTNNDIQLYPDALYCYHVVTNKWALTPNQLNAKMGALSNKVTQVAT